MKQRAGKNNNHVAENSSINNQRKKATAGTKKKGRYRQLCKIMFFLL